MAKTKHSALAAIRRSIRCSQLSKKLYVGDFLVELFTSDFDDWIRISGGGALFPQIFLTDNLTAAGYNYLDNKIASARFIPTEGTLNQGYNGRVQIDYSSYATYKRGWKTGALTGGGREIGGLNEYEAVFFADSDSLYLYEAGDLKALGTLGVSVLPDFCGAYGDLFGVTGYNTTATWNLFRGTQLYVLSPASGNSFLSWIWSPSLFVMEPANAFFMFPGWYYGETPSRGGSGSEYGFVSAGVNSADWPLTNLEVQLMGVVDCKNPTGSGLKYGWCEYVSHWETEVDNGDVRDLYFYLSESILEEASQGLNYNESGPRPFTNIAIGSALEGFKATLKIKDLSFTPTAVDMWAFKTWTDDLALTPQDDNAIGIVISNSSGQAVIYRFKGGAVVVDTISGYHSHSVSRDGSLLAVFTGSGLITSVKVFDLYGVKDGAGTADSRGYNGGGFSLLRDSVKVAAAAATQAVIIPYRTVNTAIPTSNITSIAGLGNDDTNNTYTPFATLNFPSQGQSGMSVSKLECFDGVHASFNVAIDECFDTEIIIDDPETTSARDRLVGTWNIGGGVKGLVRGYFTGSGTSTRFNPLGTGRVVTLGSINLIENGGLGGDVLVDGVIVGDLILESCLEYDIYGGISYVSACQDDLNCGGPITASVTTTCGQSSTLVVTKEVPELVVFSTGPPDHGSTGGFGTKTWSFDKGSIDENGTVTDVTSCSDPDGDPSFGTVTVTDECGTSASIDYQLPAGVWVWDGTWDIVWSTTEQCNFLSPPVAGGPCGAPIDYVQWKDVYSYIYDPGGPFESTRYCGTSGVCVKHYVLECP